MRSRVSIRNRIPPSVGRVGIALIPFFGLLAASCSSPSVAIDSFSTSSIPAAPTAQTAAPAVAAAPKLHTEEVLFGKVSVPFGNEGWMEKWRRVRDAADSGLLQSRCAGTALCRKKRVARIRENIDAAWQMTPLQRLAVANRVINQELIYKEDDPFTDGGDHWQTFRESIERGAGDCEDFAIAKMEMLAAMGTPADKMTLVVVKDITKDRHHAVLVVDMNGSNLVLDVEDDRITGDAQDINYDPMFSFNLDSMRVYGNRIAGAPEIRPAA